MVAINLLGWFCLMSGYANMNDPAISLFFFVMGAFYFLLSLVLKLRGK